LINVTIFEKCNNLGTIRGNIFFNKINVIC